MQEGTSMKPQIGLITILTDDVPALVQFYRDALGFEVLQDMGNYVEFRCTGVRFAICARSIMEQATGHTSFKQKARGQSFELAFPLATPESVDKAYGAVISKGARPVHIPANMPWGQRTAFFADPDGNIHELYADLPKST
jgi:lactoylglutathione lyase